jgi:mRNA interferase MazF
MALEPGAVRRGAVVVVRIAGDKARPAVVMRSDLLADLSYATVLLITSNPRDGISMRIDLDPDPKNGLRTASQVMVDWPQTVRLSAMAEIIGRLDAPTMQTITRQLAVVLGIGARTVARRRTPPATRI